jgi:lysophospholipase L1-like esterase
VRRAIAVLVTIGALLSGAPHATAQSDIRAVGDWSMVPQSRDANGDGFIDGDGGVPRARPLGSEPAKKFVGAGNRIAQPSERLIGGSQSWYLNPRGFSLRLDACDSRGEEYQWRIYRGDKQIDRTRWRALKSKTCTRTVRLQEGSYRFKLEVRTGVTNEFQWLNATVKDYLFVVLGDSYASGEGNPRNVQAWIDNPDQPFAPYYDDSACNRSTRSGPAQAALALENSSSKSSVTLIDVSCSGATVNTGVLGPQRVAGQSLSQIQQVQQLIGNREVDIAVFSVGGNDIGFTSILSACALSLDCPLTRASTPPLNRFDNVQQGVQNLTSRLPDAYGRIAACLGGDSCALTDGTQIPSLKLAANARVLPMTYPDITRSAVGQPCSYLTISRSDFAWARDTILVPQAPNPYRFTTFGGSTRDLSTGAGTLNGQIIGTSRFGWQPVVGIWGGSGDSATGHGVCAGSDAWVFGLTGLTGPFASASFHPNPAGQQFTGREIARLLGVG